MYVHVRNEDMAWYLDSEKEILTEMSSVLCDHISLVQQCYHQQYAAGSSAGVDASPEVLHHMKGVSIEITYCIRKNNTQYDNTLVFRSTEQDTVPDTMSVSSFCLNPLYIRPLNEKKTTEESE